jgi:hypothetical protein
MLGKRVRCVRDSVRAKRNPVACGATLRPTEGSRNLVDMGGILLRAPHWIEKSSGEVGDASPLKRIEVL